MSASYTMEKKGLAAKKVFGQLNGYNKDYNTVHAVVSKRMSQQKYAIEHMRALEFIRMFPCNEVNPIRLSMCYSRNNWVENDLKKVCIISTTKNIIFLKVHWVKNRYRNTDQH